MRQGLNAAALNSTLELGRFMDYVLTKQKKLTCMSWSWNIFILQNVATTVIDYYFSLGEDPIIQIQ